MLISKLVPKGMKLSVMWSMHDVTQSKSLSKMFCQRAYQENLLVQHRIHDLFDGQKLPLIRSIS